ncbi:MAG: HD domain-containing protein, partial [Vulcanimicrobiaceae bacterium]
SYLLESVKLGSLRLYDAYLRGDEPPYPRYPELVAHVKKLLSPLVARLREFDCDLVIGTSGTIMGLAALDDGDRGSHPVIHGHALSLERLRVLQARMLTMTEAQRRTLPGMNARRADIIIAGAAVLIEGLVGIGAREIVVSQHALREGVVVDLVQGDSEISRRLDALRARRRESVAALARRYQSSGLHERSVARLALRIFDELAPNLPANPADRELIHAAALLHDVGKFVNTSAHHKHGAYLIRNSVLDGWSDSERELLATIVRYHRKAPPKTTHPEWMALGTLERDRVALLAGIIRVADGLDVRQQGVVSDVRVRWSPAAVAIEVEANDSESRGELAVEIAAAGYKADLLAKALGKPVIPRGVAAISAEA